LVEQRKLLLDYSLQHSAGAVEVNSDSSNKSSECGSVGEELAVNSLSKMAAQATRFSVKPGSKSTEILQSQAQARKFLFFQVTKFDNRRLKLEKNE